MSWSECIFYCVAVAMPLRLLKSPVHPHACGEQNQLLYSSSNNTGSSSRMWGTVVPSFIVAYSRV